MIYSVCTAESKGSKHMVLAQKQTHRSTEKDRKPGNKPMHLWSIVFNKEDKNILTPGEKDSLSAGGAGKVE